jgi:hypothetical protein
MAGFLASINDKEFLGWSGSSKDDLVFANPVLQVLSLRWVRIVEVLFGQMPFGKEVTMNNDSSALFKSLFLGDLQFIDHVVPFFLWVLDDVDLVGNGGSSWWLITSDHDNLNTSLTALVDGDIDLGSRRIIEGDNTAKNEIVHGEGSGLIGIGGVRDTFVGLAEFLPALHVELIGLVEFGRIQVEVGKSEDTLTHATEVNVSLVDLILVHLSEVNNTIGGQIKFNAFIRDMSADNGNLRIYLKGAPERVIERCNKIMTSDGIVDFTQMYKDEVNQANVDFGGMGERVLAFAYLDLDPSKFNKAYQFNMKGWKEFGEAYKGVSYSSYADQPGAFPMHDLVLCGVVSLNDPPRPKVDISVDKCRQAGIKVIMVTGDQPPTAAAIAN